MNCLIVFIEFSMEVDTPFNCEYNYIIGETLKDTIVSAAINKVKCLRVD